MKIWQKSIEKLPAFESYVLKLNSCIMHETKSEEIKKTWEALIKDLEEVSHVTYNGNTLMLNKSKEINMLTEKEAEKITRRLSEAFCLKEVSFQE